MPKKPLKHDRNDRARKVGHSLCILNAYHYHLAFWIVIIVTLLCQKVYLFVKEILFSRCEEYWIFLRVGQKAMHIVKKKILLGEKLHYELFFACPKIRKESKNGDRECREKNYCRRQLTPASSLWNVNSEAFYGFLFLF